MVADKKVVGNQPSGVQPYVQLKKKRGDKVQPPKRGTRQLSPRPLKHAKLHWQIELVKWHPPSGDIENTEALVGPSCPDAIAFGVL